MLVWRSGFIALLGSVVVYGCSGSDGGGEAGAGSGGRSTASGGTAGVPAKRIWQCGSSSGDACTCHAFLDSGDMGVFPPGPSACEFYDCCFLEEPRASSEAVAACTCIDSASCEAEVASRPGTRMVASCPPSGEGAPAACAEYGLNCRPDYLEDNGLDGCCDGLLCKPNADGVPVCSPGTTEELELDRQCRMVVSRRESTIVPSRAALSTDAGAIPFDAVRYSFLFSGAGGCLSEVWLTLGQQASPDSCSLSVRAGPSLDADGAFRIDSAIAMLDGCQGSPFAPEAQIFGGSLGGSVRFEGVSCADTGLILDDHYCYAGTWTIALTGGLSVREPPATSRSVSLTGEPIVVSGGDCATTTTSNRCP